MTTCVVVGLPTPLLPIHLLWINLVTDGLPALCLATDPIDSDVMARKPLSRSAKITDPAFLRTMVYTGLLTAGVAFGVYFHGVRSGSLLAARTSAFAALVFAELLRSFGARSATKPVWRMSFFANLNLSLVVAVSIGIQVLSQHNAMLGRFLKVSPIPFRDGFILLALGALPLLVLDLMKGLRAKETRLL